MRTYPKIGRCKNFSIPVAALIFFYDHLPKKDADLGHKWQTIDYGELDWMHEIVEIAGGKQCGMYTSGQVSKSLAQSPYWESIYIPGYYGGYGNGGANLYRPSEKGKIKYQLTRNGTKFIKEYETC